MGLGLGWSWSNYAEPTPATGGIDFSEVSGVSTHKELVLVYVGASACAASSRREMQEVLVKVRAGLGERASALGLRFVSVGVALDWNVREGLAHLSAAGPFDEVNAGQHALNAGALRYIVIVRRVGLTETETWLARGMPTPLIQ